MTTSLRRRLHYTLATSVRFEATVRRWSPLEEQADRLLRRFVAGTTLDDAVGVIEDLSRKGLRVSLDLFGEGATDDQVTLDVGLTPSEVGLHGDDEWCTLPVETDGQLHDLRGVSRPQRRW